MDNIKYHELYILYKTIISEEDSRFNDKMINHDSISNYYKWIKFTDFEKENLLPVVLRTLSDSDEFRHIINNDLG